MTDAISAIIKRLRINAGFASLGELSRVSDVTVATLSRIESGVQAPSPKTLKKLAPFLNTHHEELMLAAGYLDKNDKNLVTSQTDSKTSPLPLSTELLPLSPKEERDIAKDLEKILSNLESDEALAYNGEPMDDETKELMKISLENSMRLAKQLAKKKFTPEKYK